MVKFVKMRDPSEIAEAIAKEFITQLQIKRDSVFGFATGSSPIPLYKKLIEDFHNGLTDYCLAKSVNLDEYIGLSPNHEQSYAYFMKKNLFDHINIMPKNTHVPDIKDNYLKDTSEYQKILDSVGQRDIQILGIGTNGHIGFNEPAASLHAHTHIVRLTDSTTKANSRFFKSEDVVPEYAITMGIADILNSRKIFLIATGCSKASIIETLYNTQGFVNPQNPASMLFLHSDCTILVDEDAASNIPL